MYPSVSWKSSCPSRVKDKFKIKVDVTTDETVAQDTDIDADMTFQVTAKPL
jgi:hypothetical protein